MIGINKSRGTSIIDLPMKYADVVYSFEFSSLKNTALSTGNEITVGIHADIKWFIQKKNKTIYMYKYKDIG